MPKVMTIGSMKDSDMLPAGSYKGPVGRLTALGGHKAPRGLSCQYVVTAGGADYVPRTNTKKSAQALAKQLRANGERGVKVQLDCPASGPIGTRDRRGVGFVTIEGSLSGLRKRKTRKRRKR